jgi:hypothetical protein
MLMGIPHLRQYAFRSREGAKFHTWLGGRARYSPGNFIDSSITPREKVLIYSEEEFSNAVASVQFGSLSKFNALAK